GQSAEVSRSGLVVPPPSTLGTSSGGGDKSSAKPVAASDRGLKLSLLSIIDVLPTAVGQKVPLAAFKPKDPDSIRQLWQIGETTELFSQDGERVVAGAGLPALLSALKTSDYLAVNAIFRKVGGYARVLWTKRRAPECSRRAAGRGCYRLC